MPVAPGRRRSTGPCSAAKRPTGDRFPREPSGSRQSTEGRAGLTCCGEGYNLRSMPRVGQFCPSNIARLLLGIFIIVTLLIAIGFWLYHSPGHGTLIEQPTHYPAPNK